MSSTSVAPRRKPPALRADRLTGGQKAAILMMALGPDGAEELAKGLDADELEAISLEIAQLDHVPADIVAAVLDEWQNSAGASQADALGGIRVAQTFLERTVGVPAAAPVVQRLKTRLQEGSGFKTLRRVDPESLANLLRSEHPQAVALVLAHLEPSLVSDILIHFDPSFGGDVLVRKASMEKVLPDVLEVVERFLGSEASFSLSGPLTQAGGPGAVADVLNLTASAHEKELLEAMARRDPRLADKIKELMFVFDDVRRLDSKATQRVVMEIDTKDLALALKGASDEVRDQVFGAMSQRAAAALTQEMEFLGPARLKDVEEAQRTIVNEIRRLEEAGEIVIGGFDDDVLL